MLEYLFHDFLINIQILTKHATNTFETILIKLRKTIETFYLR